MPTRRALRSELLDLASLSDDGDFAKMLNTAINHVYFEILQAANIATEQRRFTLTTVASQKNYALPSGVLEVKNIEDPDNKRQLWAADTAAVEHTYPADTTTGTPRVAYPYGKYGVCAQTVGATVRLVSTSALDEGGNYKALVTGLVAGEPRREVVTLTGTSPATTTITWTAGGLHRISTVAPDGALLNGVVTATDTGGSTTLTSIPPWVGSIDYLWISLYPTPASAIAYALRVEARKAPLVYEEDWPDLETEWHDLIVQGVGGRLFAFVGKSTLAKEMQGRFETRLQDFKRMTNRAANRVQQYSDVRPSTSRNPRIPLPILP